MSVKQNDMLRTSLLFLTFLFIFSSCYKDDNTSKNIVVRDYPNTIVEGTDINGVVLYADQSLAEVSKIQFGGDNATSINPYFYFKSKNINQYFEVLSFQTNQGLTLYYPIANVANTINNHSIEIPSSIEKITMNTGPTAIIQIDEYPNLELNYSSFTKEGANVQAPEIYYTLLENESLPGNMRGLDSDNKPMVIIPSKVFYVGWVDTDIIYFEDEDNPIQDFYKLDLESGAWRKSDSGVNHSGFYAYGKDIAATESEIEIESDFQVEGIESTVNYDNQQIMRFQLSDNNKIATFLPLEEDFQIVVSNQDIELDNEDYFLSTSEDLNITLEDISIETVDIEIFSKDCSDMTLKESILYISGDDDYSEHFLIKGNALRIQKPSSTNLSFKLIATNSEETTLPITFQNDNLIQLGRQYLCEEIEDEYIYFLVEGNKRILSNIVTEHNSPSIAIRGTETTEGIDFRLKFNATGIGSLDDMDANISLEAPGLDKGLRLNCLDSESGCGFETFDITLFKSTENEYIKGRFKGSFWIESLEDENVGYRVMEGEFQVKVL